MRAKSIAVFLTVVIALIGVSLFQVDRVLFSDQIAAGEATSRSQMAALIPAFQSEFKSINEHFKFAGPVALVRPVDFTDTISNRFEMVARLVPASGGWSVADKVFHEKTKVKSWAENYTSIALKSVKPRDLPLGGTALTALLDPQRKPFFLWIMRDERDQWWAAITKADVFQAIIDRQRGQTTSVFLVNRQGQALGHTTSEYLGTILKDDPVVQELIRSNKRSGVGLFDERVGQVQGFYELIPGTNVSVVLARPMTSLQDSRSSLRWQLLLFGGGLALLGLAALILFVKEQPRAQGTSAPGAMPLYGAGSLPPSPHAPAGPAMPVPPLSFDQKSELVRERTKAYTTAASALAREMHGPLTRILSQTQILKGKSINEPELSRIEELARDGRNVVLKLLSFAGEEEFKAEPTSINEVLQRTLGLFEPKFQQKGIKLEKNLKRMPEIQAHPLALMKIFEAILNNAIESMERMPSKTLMLDLDAEGSFAVLKVKDSGEGLSADKVGQVFDPFFTTKSPSVHSGLGLATVYGLVREFGGELRFDSSEGQGSTLMIRFPIGISTVAVAAAATVATAPPVAPRVMPALRADPQSPAGGEFDLELAGEFATAASMIQDRAIEQTLSMIDQVEMPSNRAPVNPRIDPPPVRSSESTAGGKLDRPSFGPKKPPPKAAPAGVQIRKPGERK